MFSVSDVLVQVFERFQLKKSVKKHFVEFSRPLKTERFHLSDGFV